MENNYTIHNQNSILEYSSIDATEEGVDYIKNPESFCSFDKGLITLLKKKGYSGDLCNVAEMTEYLMKKLEKIGSSIKKQTLFSWFSGKNRPKVEAGSRFKIYEICFAMELTYKETCWFFGHIYYDRAFNYHTIDEAVFYYAFLNGISYPEAQRIIGEIEAAPSVATENNIEPNYTLSVQKRISEFRSEGELKEFLVVNKENFKTWNTSASKKIHELVSLLLDPPEMKERIDNLKRDLTQKTEKKDTDESKSPEEQKRKELKLLREGEEIYQNCGLLMKEIFYDAKYPDKEYGNARMVPEESVMEFIRNRNTNSNNFLLERLLTTSCGIRKDIEIPYIVRNNFPSKKVISDLLSEEKISTSKSYDGIRKMIILLDFYRFWLSVKLKIGYTEMTKEELTEIYRDEANHCLYECGYEELYPGNPYDWIFLSSAYSEAPLVYLRSYITELDDVL